MQRTAEEILNHLYRNRDVLEKNHKNMVYEQMKMEAYATDECYDKKQVEETLLIIRGQMLATKEMIDYITGGK